MLTCPRVRAMIGFVDEVARRRWEKSLRALRQESDRAGRAWQRAGGYWPVDGTPPSQPELLAVARAAQERYYAAAAECYPKNFEEMLQGIRVGKRDAIESAIEWLEADYFTRWTGYTKQKIMYRLVQARLTDPDKERLRKVVLAVCTRGRRKEFREVRRLARRQLASSQFAGELQALANGADSAETRAAALMVLDAVEQAQ